MTAGHLGKWIAARIFGIALEPSATATAIDGRFTSGVLRDRTVNVRWYLKREGLLDVTPSDALDDYLVLVMTGPAAPPAHSRDGVRPRCRTSVYLFDARQSGRRVGPSSAPDIAPDTAPAPRTGAARHR
jgi:hypothetical protein